MCCIIGAASLRLQIKAKGGDPHGAIQRMENEELEKLRKAKKESQEELNVSPSNLNQI